VSRRRYVIAGDGPAGLALAVLLAGRGEEVELYGEPSRAAGVGIVLDEEAIALLARVDEDCAEEILAACQSWKTVHLRIADDLITSGGHHIRGIGRDSLVAALTRRAAARGVRLRRQRWHERGQERDRDLVVGADGAGSAVRQASAADFGTTVTSGATRYLWMRAQARLDPGFSFVSTEHGAFVAHVYPYSGRYSALVVEARPECLASAGLLRADRPATERALRRIFSDHLELDGLRAVTFPWQSFRTVCNRRWHAGNRVLIGDAAHTAHFSVGSGTRLAIEDAVVLAAELEACPDVATAVLRFEERQRPVVAELQDDGRSSEMWFADMDRHMRLPPKQLAFALRTRREVNGYSWLRQRDPAFVASLDRALTGDSRRLPARGPYAGAATEPRLLPLRLGSLVIPRRKVVLADGAGPADYADAGLVLGGPRLPAADGLPAGLIVPAPGPLPDLDGAARGAVLLTGRWPGLRAALTELRRCAPAAGAGVLLDPRDLAQADVPRLAGLADFVAVPAGNRGQRVERTALAERLRNEFGLTVLLWTHALDSDEANTLIAAARTDGYVIARKG